VRKIPLDCLRALSGFVGAHVCSFEKRVVSLGGALGIVYYFVVPHLRPGRCDSRHKNSAYRSGPCKSWINVKNRGATARDDSL
jgi:hypothetical protein